MARTKKQTEIPAASPEIAAINEVQPNSRSGVNFEGKTVVVSKRFYGEAKDPSGNFYAAGDRRFVAHGGFGCNPASLGSAVMGYFIVDGEAARIERGDVEGLAVVEKTAADDARAEQWYNKRYS